MGALTTAYVLVAPDMRSFGKDLKLGLRRVDVSSAGRDAGNRFGSSFHSSSGKLLKRGLVGTGLAVGAAFGTALTKGFGRLSAIENAEAKLTGLGHSAKTVDTIMGNALKSVKGTAFGLDEAATVAATAVAAGIKPGKELEGTLKLVADAATIGGTSLAEMGGIFSDVAASNKVQGDTINQLNERGIPILKLLGDALGIPQTEVSKLASQGKIDFATFQEAMEKGLGGAAVKSGDTATGAFKNMGAAFSRVGAALLKGVFPQIGAGFGTITTFLDNITPAAGRFGEAVGTAFSTVSTFVRERLLPAFDDIKTKALPGLQVVGDFIRTSVLPVLGRLAGFITDVVVPAWAGWYGFLLKQLWPILKQVGDFIRESIVPAFKIVADFIVKEVVPRFVDIQNALKDLVRVVGPIVGEIVGVITGKFKEMSPEIKSIWTSVKEIITGVMFIIQEVIGSVTTIIKLIWDKHGKDIKRIVGAVFGAIFKIIAGVMKTVAGVIKLFVALIKGDWKGAWTAIKQIFAGIWQAIKAILTITMGQIVGFFTTRLATIRTKWTEMWTRVKDGARSAMDWVHTKITGVLDKIKNAFLKAKNYIGTTWDRVKNAVSAPIVWVKDHVYNTPLVPVWNAVAKLVGAKELPKFATGGIDPYGVRPGYTPGRDTHTIAVGGGEAIMRPEWTRAAGKGYVNDANRAARTGGVAGAEAFVAKRGLPGFAGGGIVDWMKSTISSAGAAIGGLAGKLKDWALGGLRDAAAKVLSPLRDVIKSQLSGSGVRDTAGKVANKALDLILDKIKKSDDAAMSAAGGGGPIGSGGFATAERWARTQIGKPYQFAAVGPGSYDCSGFVGAIHNVILGRSPHSRRYSSGTFLGGPHSRSGLTRDKVSPFRIGVIPTGQNGGRIGHMAATLNGRNFESAGGVGTRSGGSARGWNNGLFKYHYGLARGGIAGDFAFDTLDRRGQRFDPASRALVDMLYDSNALARGGVIRGGRGGVLAHIGEGANDELVTPLPKGWRGRQSDDKLDRLIAAIEQHGLNGPTLNFGDIHNPREEALSQTANKILQRVASLPLV